MITYDLTLIVLILGLLYLDKKFLLISGEDGTDDDLLTIIRLPWGFVFGETEYFIMYFALLFFNCTFLGL